MLHKTSIEFTWNSMEFEFKEKNKRWYWVTGIIIILLIILTIFLKNYLFGFIILIGGFLMFVLSTKEPILLPVEISEQGIKIHNEMYRYNTISKFWIGENSKKEPILLFTTTKHFIPTVSVPIEPHINITQLREYLLQFIKEEEMQEPFTDKLIDKIGF